MLSKGKEEKSIDEIIKNSFTTFPFFVIILIYFIINYIILSKEDRMKVINLFFCLVCSNVFGMYSGSNSVSRQLEQKRLEREVAYAQRQKQNMPTSILSSIQHANKNIRTQQDKLQQFNRQHRK